MINNNEVDMVSLAYNEETKANKEKAMHIHFHSSYEVIYITKGAAQFKVNDRVYICRNNSMLFFNHLEKHERTILEYPYHRYILLIKPQCFNGLINDPLLLSLWKQRPDHFIHLLNLEEEEIPLVNDLFTKMLIEFETKMPFWEIALGSYLYLLICMLFRKHRTHFPYTSLDEMVNIALTMQKYLDEHSTDDIFLRELAKMFNIDMYYLSHIFKKVIGYTFKEYLTLQRISKAKDLLLNSTMNITEIGTHSGFNNASHFISVFKKIESVTPYQYRKRQQNE